MTQPSNNVDRVRVEIEQDGHVVAYELAPEEGGMVKATLDIGTPVPEQDITYFARTDAMPPLTSEFTMKLEAYGRRAQLRRISPQAAAPSPEPTCVLWYWRQHAVDYSLHDSEQEAAGSAYYLEEHGEGVPIGVQFADARTIRVADWQALRDYRRDREQSAAEERANPRAPRPRRTVRDPFEGHEIKVDADEPDWIGR